MIKYCMKFLILSHYTARRSYMLREQCEWYRLFSLKMKCGMCGIRTYRISTTSFVLLLKDYNHCCSALSISFSSGSTYVLSINKVYLSLSTRGELLLIHPSILPIHPSKAFFISPILGTVYLILSV